MEPVPAGPRGFGLQGPGAQVWGMPGPIPLRNGTGEGLGYHRRARRDVQSRRLPFLVGREPGRPGGVPADRHFAQYESGARSTEVFGSDRLIHHVHIWR